jgi:hypothetical protein
MIGAGVRLNPKLTALFEQLVNLASAPACASGEALLQLWPL